MVTKDIGSWRINPPSWREIVGFAALNGQWALRRARCYGPVVAGEGRNLLKRH